MKKKVVRRKINRSEIIREYLSTAKDTSPTAVKKALAARGVKVSTALVSVVKHVRKKGRNSGVERQLERLSHASRFVKEAGSLDRAKSLLEMFGKIIS